MAKEREWWSWGLGFVAGGDCSGVQKRAVLLCTIGYGYHKVDGRTGLTSATGWTEAATASKPGESWAGREGRREDRSNRRAMAHRGQDRPFGGRSGIGD